MTTEQDLEKMIKQAEKEVEDGWSAIKNETDEIGREALLDHQKKLEYRLDCLESWR